MPLCQDTVDGLHRADATAAIAHSTDTVAAGDAVWR
jgi:hypothetical protein